MGVHAPNEVLTYVSFTLDCRKIYDHVSKGNNVSDLPVVTQSILHDSRNPDEWGLLRVSNTPAILRAGYFWQACETWILATNAAPTVECVNK
jgi:hypothetical protein